MLRSFILIQQFFRTAGVLLGVFILFNFVGDIFMEGSGIHLLCLDFNFFPYIVIVGRILLLAAALGLILATFLPLFSWWSLHCRRASMVFHTVQFFICMAIFFSSFNMIWYYYFLLKGNIISSFPVPLSLFVVIVLVMNTWRIGIEFRKGKPIDGDEPPRRFVKVNCIHMMVMIIFIPLMMMLIYGAADYTYMPMPGNSQPGELIRADCIIIYGARIKKDGTPSDALKDRLRHAVTLFKKGCSRFLVMTGGMNEDGVSEAQSMKNFAVSLGIPDERIILDEEGCSTYHSVINVKKIMDALGWQNSLSVSNGYHLLRIKIAAERVGLNTCTVPILMPKGFTFKPWYLLREIAALYYYYFSQWRI